MEVTPGQCIARETQKKRPKNGAGAGAVGGSAGVGAAAGGAVAATAAATAAANAAAAAAAAAAEVAVMEFTNLISHFTPDSFEMLCIVASRFE